MPQGIDMKGREITGFQGEPVDRTSQNAYMCLWFISLTNLMEF